MERPNAWKKYTDAQLAELEKLCADYIDFISENKIEREFTAASIKLAEGEYWDDAVALFKKEA